MTTRFKLIAASLAAPLAIGLAVPAAAAPYGNWDRDHREYRERGDHRDFRDQRGAYRIERKLDELRRDIRRATRSGEIDRRSAWSVRSRLDAAERAYANFARNGLSRRDIRMVNWRIDQAYDALAQARYSSARRYDGRRYDGRRGYRDGYRGGRRW